MLDDARAQRSDLYGRMVFVVASPESGGGLLTRALGEFPGIVRLPAPTHIFSQGVASMVGHWWYPGEDMHQGLEHFLDEQDYLEALRALVDNLLGRAGGPDEVIVEHSYGHIRMAPIIVDVFPDARFIHVVRDGRDVVTRLSSELYAFDVADAVLSWQADQEAVAEAAPDRLVTVRYEDLTADPVASLTGVVEGIGLRTDAEALQRAAGLFRSLATATDAVRDVDASAAVGLGAPETLSRFGYAVDAHDRV